MEVLFLMKQKHNKFYSKEIKLKAVEMRLAGIPVKEIMERLEITSESQVYTWYYWHRDGEFHRFEQPIGKQYTYGQGPQSKENTTTEQKNKQLEIQNKILKKYLKLKRKWKQESS